MSAPRWTLVAGGVFLTAVYVVAGKVSLTMAFVHMSASAVWPPSGIALAALLIWGIRLWPAIFVGALIVNATTTGGLGTSLGIAAGNALEAVMGAWVVNRFAGGVRCCERSRHVLLFMGFAVLGSAAVAATVGVVSLVLGEAASWHQFGRIWVTWYLGDAAGMLMVTPLLLLWSRSVQWSWHPWRMAEAGAALLTIVGVAGLVFGSVHPAPYPLTFLCLPSLLWVAFRFSPRGAMTAAFLLSVMAVHQTLVGAGPFVMTDPAESLLYLQTFMGVVVGVTLVVAVLVHEQRVGQAALTRSNAALEEGIADRTRELSRAVETMKVQILERESAELRLRASEERFRSLAETAHDAIVTANRRGVITYFNPGAERMFGYAWGEVVGQSLTMLMPERFRSIHQQGLDRYVSTRDGRVMGRTIEMTGLRKDGTEFPVDLSLSTWQMAGDMFFTSILRDMTDRKRNEEATAKLNQDLQRRTLELEQLNKELESFSYSVSHDLRAPLRSIDGFSQALLEDYGPRLDGQAQVYLKRVRSASQRMGRLIDDLLNLSRVARIDFVRSRVKVSALVHAILADLQKAEPDRDVTCVVAPEVTVQGDERLLRIALDNLLRNAWKFTGTRPQARIEFGVKREPGRTVYFIQDDGVGFDMAYAGKLFMAFQRLHDEREFPGNGIGLVTVQRIIHRHGGEVWAEGRTGAGATFFFTLPEPEAPS